MHALQTPELCRLLRNILHNNHESHNLAFAEQVVGRRFLPERTCLRSRRVISEFMVCMEMVKVWQKYGRSVFLVKVTLASVLGD